MVRLALVSILFAGVFGCEANGGDEGLFVTKIVAPQGTTCVFTGDPSEPFFSHGAISTLILPTAYLITPQVKSRITALDDETDQKTVIIDRADVDISFVDDTVGAGIDASLTHFQQKVTAPVPPNGGIADVSFVILQEGLMDALNAAGGSATSFEFEVITEFTMHGTMSGDDVASQKFTYAITVGNDVVIHEVAGTPAMGTCTATAGGTLRTGNPCNASQDEAVDCCVDDGGGFICPAPI